MIALDGSALASFLLTHGLHCLLFACVAMICERTLGRAGLPLRERLWRMVLFAPIVTATACLVDGSTSSRPAWSVRLPRWSTRAEPIVARSTEVEALSPARDWTLPASTSEDGEVRFPEESLAAARIPLVRGDQADPGPPALRERLPARWWSRAFPALVGLSWIFLAFLPAIRLRHWLGARAPISSGLWSEELERLRRAAGLRHPIRLTTSKRIASPIAFGWLRPEICVPERAAHELAPELVQAVLAHELAHLARRDPLWMASGALVRRVFFFQPLAGIAQGRLLHLAELDCDRRAVGLTGDPLSMARCLTEVASWLRASSAPALCAMAGPCSRLEERVRRLLERQGPAHPGRRLLAGASLLLLLSPLCLPSLAIGVAREEAEPEPAPLGDEQAELQARLLELHQQLRGLANEELRPKEADEHARLSEQAARLASRADVLEQRIREHEQRAPSPIQLR